MIQIENITYSYRKNQKLFSDFSFTPAPSGGICGLLGEHGAGKTTLLHHMAGLLLPSKGCIRFDGIEVAKRQPSTLSDIFLVPEEFSLPAMSMKDYVKLMSPFYPRFSREDFSRYLGLFEMDDKHYLAELSMGQKKKVFIAFALATNTRVLLMDEPTNGLDINGKSQFRKLAAAVSREEERTWIISTHQVNDIERLIDRVAILHNNRIILNEPVERLAERLCFIDIEGREIPEEALASMPTFGGSRIMLPNKEGIDSDLSLELLFKGALAHAITMNDLFNSSNEKP